MNFYDKRAAELQPGGASNLLDVLIRAGLIFALAVLCYQIFSPFLTLMVWAVILAVALYPLQAIIAARIGGRPGLAATVLVILGIALIIVPTAILMSSLGDSVQRLVTDVRNNAIVIPAPPDSVSGWPVIGEKVHGAWSRAHDDLPGLVQSMQPKIGDLAKSALAFVASIGGGLLQFLASFIIAGILMAFGESGSRASSAIFERVAGADRGAEFAKLATATIRAPRGIAVRARPSG
jgi:predicted PurR-regulated permease PerM